MKRINMLWLSCLPLAALADNIEITRPALTLENDTLRVEFSLDVEAVKVNREQTYAFTPVLRNGKQERPLPPVIVTGKNRQNYKMRRLERRMARKGGYESPYVVIRGRQENREDLVRYAVEVPYEEWMNSPVMALLEEKKTCYESPVLDIAVIEPEPVVEAPVLPQAGEFCEACMDMVSFIEPRQDSVKVRSEAVTLYVDYPVGGVAFNPSYKNNAAELEKLKAILQPLAGSDLIIFRSVRVCGYASPDGSEATNKRVSAKRAENFVSYLGKEEKYHFSTDGVLEVTSAGEDWEGLTEMLEADKPAYADKTLKVIKENENLDVRERRLKAALGASYRELMNTYYSRLRRLAVSIDYEVKEVTDPREAEKLLYSDPGKLSIAEMYLVARMYRPGSKEYRRAYEIAADTYPQDVTANVNAASANIVSGDFQNAKKYLERVKDDERAYNNLGVLAWQEGRFDEAKEWFGRALSAEPEKAQNNLERMPE